jgi:hypothetical protein
MGVAGHPHFGQGGGLCQFWRWPKPSPFGLRVVRLPPMTKTFFLFLFSLWPLEGPKHPNTKGGCPPNIFLKNKKKKKKKKKRIEKKRKKKKKPQNNNKKMW